MTVKAPFDFPQEGLVGAILTQLNAIQTDLAALRSALNAHTHVENTDATYTQNATTGAGPTLPALTSQQIQKL